MLFVIQRNEDKKYFRTNKKGHLYDNWVDDINEVTLYHSEVEGGKWSYFDKRFYNQVFVEIKESKYGKRDGRLQIIQPSQNIRTMLETDGYPFKSKEHSQKVALYQHSGETKTIINYLGKGSKKTFLCPEKLRYNFTESFKLKVSDKCCFRLKKEPAQKWSKENRF